MHDRKWMMNIDNDTVDSMIKLGHLDNYDVCKSHSMSSPQEIRGII